MSFQPNLQPEVMCFSPQGQQRELARILALIECKRNKAACVHAMFVQSIPSEGPVAIICIACARDIFMALSGIYYKDSCPQLSMKHLFFPRQCRSKTAHLTSVRHFLGDFSRLRGLDTNTVQSCWSSCIMRIKQKAAARNKLFDRANGMHKVMTKEDRHLCRRQTLYPEP